MTCAEDKSSYLVSFGLAPYFYDELTRSLSDVHFYSVSYDEAYNRFTKKEQLDLAVRYWDVSLNKLATRYLGYEFLRHSTAENLKTDLMEEVKVTKGKILKVEADLKKKWH